MSPFFVALTLTDVLLLTLIVALPLRVAWFAKLAAIVIVLAFNFFAWSSADSGKGWPASAALPDAAQFVSCEIVEPDTATQTVGAIYVWVIPLSFKHGLLSYRSTAQEPRAYVEPYDRSLHIACVAAQKAAQRGLSVTIHQTHGNARGQRTNSHGHHHGQSGGGGLQTPGGKYKVYLLPSVTLPPKEGGS